MQVQSREIIFGKLNRFTVVNYFAIVLKRSNLQKWLIKSTSKSFIRSTPGMNV